MELFLADNKLEHLHDILVTKLTLDEAASVFEESRPKLLENLKELGVAKLPDRQAFAKAVSKRQREIAAGGATTSSPPTGEVRAPIASAAAPARPPSGVLRMLSLHGGGSNKSVNNVQMSRLRRALGPPESFSIEFFEGSREFASEQVNPFIKKMFGDGPYFGFYGVENERNVKAVPRADGLPDEYVQAMMDPSCRFFYTGYEEALDRLEKHIADTGPYDALIGFSMGAIMITMLTARTLQRAARGEAPPPTWHCNVLLSALPPRTSPYAPIYPEGGTPLHETPPIDLPCIACMGKQDEWFEYGKKGLHSIYSNLQWLEHTGGHECAKEPEVNDDLAARIRRAAGVDASAAAPPTIVTLS